MNKKEFKEREVNGKDRVVRTTIEPYRRPPLILSLVYAHGQ